MAELISSPLLSLPARLPLPAFFPVTLSAGRWGRIQLPPRRIRGSSGQICHQPCPWRGRAVGGGAAAAARCRSSRGLPMARALLTLWLGWLGPWPRRRRRAPGLAVVSHTPPALEEAGG